MVCAGCAEKNCPMNLNTLLVTCAWHKKRHTVSVVKKESTEKIVKEVDVMAEFLLLGLKCGVLGLAAISVFVVGIILLIPLYTTVAVLLGMLMNRLGGTRNE